MRTFKEIIDNQKTFKNEILLFLTDEVKEAKSNLKSINSKDEWILAEKKKLEKHFNKANSKFKKSFEKMFFMHPNRNKEKYVWWEETNKKALILNYEK